MKICFGKIGLIAGLFICLMAFTLTSADAASVKTVAVPACDGGTSEEFSVALLDNGTVWVWGSNVGGVLGGANPPLSFVPLKIDISNVKDIAAGPAYVLALKDDGTVWAWGRDFDGCLQSSSGQKFLAPKQIVGVNNVIKIATGLGACFALESDGSLWAWGDNRFGELGIGNTSGESVVTPMQVSIGNVKDVACAFGTTFILKNDGTVWVSGSGDNGLHGNGGTQSSDAFAQVPISNVKAISCGYDHVLAVKDDGTLWSWGNNRQHQTGNISDYEYQPIPTKVLSINNVVAVSGGGWHSLALKDDGTVWVWGSNQMCTYGIGSTSGIDSIYPIKIPGFDHVKAISAGFFHNFALKDDGTLWGWGTDDVGAVGVGTHVPNLSGIYNGSSWGISVVVPTQVLFDQPDRKYYPFYPPSASVTPITNVSQSTAKPASSTILDRLTFSNNYHLQYIAAAEDGTLYGFDNNTIYCYDGKGQLKWNLSIPDQWEICREWSRPIDNQIVNGLWLTKTMAEPIYDIGDGYLYVYATPGAEYPEYSNFYQNDRNISINGLSRDLLAISTDGKIAWSRPLKTGITAFDDTVVKALGDRIYVFHSYNETVFDKSGKEMFTISNISEPAAIDEHGNLYVTPAVERHWHVNQYEIDGREQYADYRTPSTIVEAYNSNGSMIWSKDVGTAINNQYVAEDIRPTFSSMPIYQNGTLYVMSFRDVIALDTKGNTRWTKAYDNGYYVLFELMPLDSKGNLYLRKVPISGAIDQSCLYVVGPDGKDACPPRNYSMQYGLGNWVAANDGIYYMADSTGTSIHGNFKPPGNESLYDMPVTVISAYDIINDTVLWQYQVPVGDKHETMINKDNARDLLGLGMESYDMSWLNDDKKIITQVDTWTKIRIYPVHGNIYVSYMAANIEEPYVLNQSRCVYSSGIYALDSKGTAMLEKPTGAYNSMFASNNSTIFYLADGGKITVMTIGVAVTGLAALVAAALLFFKFIGIGSVTRARSRVDKNENRNTLLKYIVDNPGVTMYEITKALGMNMGTTRYHLLILGVNHRIATFKDDNKFIRYFPNSNRYSKEEQLLISMIRRDTIKRVIQLVFMKPGLTNAEISCVTGLADSGVSRYLKELCDKGIVTRSEGSSGRYTYSLTEDAAKTVEKVYWVISGEGKERILGVGNAEA